MQIDFINVPGIKVADFARFAKDYFQVDVETNTSASPAFLRNLAKLKGVTYDECNAGSYLRHLSYSVLIKDDPRIIDDVQTESSLATLRLNGSCDRDDVLLLSGNLVEFRSEIINGCSDMADPSFRQYTSKLLLRLDQQGFGQMFNQYARKIKPHTNELILVHKQ